MFDEISDDDLYIIPLTARHNLSIFNSRSNELNDFFKNDALYDQNNLISRTTLCYHNNYNVSPIGFLTLIADTIEVKVLDQNEVIDEREYKKYPCVKIARLAVDLKFERKGIGQFLLSAAVGKTLSVCNDIGCRYITVDSKRDSIEFYRKNGFKLVEKYKSKDFPKMYMNIKPIIEMLQPSESLDMFE